MANKLFGVQTKQGDFREKKIQTYLKKSTQYKKIFFVFLLLYPFYKYHAQPPRYDVTPKR